MSHDCLFCFQNLSLILITIGFDLKWFNYVMNIDYWLI